MKNFRKTAYVIRKLRKKYAENVYQTIFLSTFYYHKHEIEMARFRARAPRAGTVDVKRLIYDPLSVKVVLSLLLSQISAERRGYLKMFKTIVVM